jgi:hypothetical protein
VSLRGIGEVGHPLIIQAMESEEDLLNVIQAKEGIEMSYVNIMYSVCVQGIK